MDDIIEILLELVFECSIELIKNKKVSKWIRYPLAFIIGILFIIVIIGINFIGIMLLEETVIGGVIFVI